MKVCVKRIEGLDTADEVFVTITERNRSDRLEYSSTPKFATDSTVSIDFEASLVFPIVEQLIFSIFTKSKLHGTHPLGRFILSSQYIDLDHEISKQFETEPPSDKSPTLIFEFTPLPQLSKDTESFDGEHAVEKFMTLIVRRDQLKLALISVTDQNKFASVSRFHFNSLGFCDFTEDTIFLRTQEIGSMWKKFVVFVEGNGSLQIEIIMDGKERLKKTFNTDSQSFMPLLFSFNKTSVDLTSVSTPTPRTFKELYSNLAEILQTISIFVPLLPKMLKFDTSCDFFGDMQINSKSVAVERLKILLRHEARGSIDLSIGEVSSSLTLRDVCFFNNKSIIEGRVRLVDPPKEFDSYLSVTFGGIPEKVTLLLITLTVFAQTPLNKFGRATLTFMNQDDDVLLHVPLTLPSECGFCVGGLERVNGKSWKFAYYGIPLAGVANPGVALKRALETLAHTDDGDEIVWE